MRILHDKGIFQVKEAVQVAHALDISKNTVYLHLRNWLTAVRMNAGSKSGKAGGGRQ